jgi:hypothetical protein
MIDDRLLWKHPAKAIRWEMLLNAAGIEYTDCLKDG